ncbi:MAG: HNH endonuclease [Solibacillus isronensis]
MRNKSKLRLAMEINNSPSNPRRQHRGGSGYHSNTNNHSTLNKQTSNTATQSNTATASTRKAPKPITPSSGGGGGTALKTAGAVATATAVTAGATAVTAKTVAPSAPNQKPVKTPVRIVDPTEPPKQPKTSTAKPKRRLTGNNSTTAPSASPSKGKSENKDASLFTRVIGGKNERSDTYRRDFIKANPPFMGKWYLCSLCNKIIRVEDMQVDHIFPVSKGGSNKTHNLAPLCAPCNRDKSNKVDSRVAQMYIRKFGGKAIGVPVSLAFGAVTKIGKFGAKGGLMLGKGIFSIALKGLAMGITAFLASSMKFKLVIVGVIVFLLLSQGIISF